MSDEPRSGGEPDDGDYDDLGAAPTVPVASSGRGAADDRSRRRLRMPSRRPRSRVAIVVTIIVVLALIPIVTTVLGSSLYRTPRNMVGISYGGGPFESAHFQRIVQPGSPLFFNGWFDPLYLYPADTQAYIVSKVVGQGAVKQPDSIIAPSKDLVPIEYQVAAYFRLNIDRLRAFHETLGLQYAAYTSAGWQRLIQDTFRQQLENAIQEKTRQYAVGDIYGNANTLGQLQKDIEQDLSDRLTNALGQPFFCRPTYTIGGQCGSPTFIIKRIDIPQDLAQSFTNVRNSQVQIESRTAEAQAIEALNQGLAAGGMNYVLLRAIESGNISFWVLPNDGSTNLTVPAGGGAPAAPTTTTPSSSSSGR